MLTKSMIAAAALFGGAFLIQAPADAAPASGLKDGVSAPQAVQLVGGRHDHDRHGRHDDWRHRDRHDRHGRHDLRGRSDWQPHFGGYHGLRNHGYLKFGNVRWDGRAFLVRAYHPRYGWVWVRLDGRSGAPIARWR